MFALQSSTFLQVSKVNFIFCNNSIFNFIKTEEFVICGSLPNSISNVIHCFCNCKWTPDTAWYYFGLHPPTYSVHITDNCTSLRPALGEVYPIQQCYQWRVAGRWFPLGTLISLTNKTDHNGINKIFLKVSLHTVINSIFL